MTAAPTYTPSRGNDNRDRCLHCGTLKRLHVYDLRCPTAYRPTTLAEAQRELERAQASGDAGRVFVARGDVQRLGGKP